MQFRSGGKPEKQSIEALAECHKKAYNVSEVIFVISRKIIIDIIFIPLYENSINKQIVLILNYNFYFTERCLL